MNNDLKKISATAIFAALIAVIAMYVKIPLANGYVHPADALIFFAAVLLPKPYALSGAAIGGALADVISGYAIYAPFTAVIKALLAISFSRKKNIVSVRNLVALALSVFITPVGYFLTEVILYDTEAALAGILFNLLQALVSAALFLVIGVFSDRYNLKKRLVL